MPNPPTERVIAFDLDSDGHHSSYLHVLASRWLEREVETELVVVVGEDFPERHAAVVALAEPGRVRFETRRRPKPEIAGRRLPVLVGAFASGIAQWRVLQEVVRQERASHAVAMYIDPLLMAPIPMQLPIDCPVSGIYFRPSFYYPTLGHQETRADKVRSMRQRLTLKSALRHRKLHTVWSLDPYAVPHIEALGLRPGGARIAPIAEPVDAVASPAAVTRELRKRYGLTRDSKTLLLFGALGPRKGIVESIGAVRQVATANAQRDLTLLVVGRAPEHFRDRLARELASVEAAGVRVVRNSSFVAESEVQAHFEVSDIVLATYQRHVGGSSIAVRAARAGKPLLGSDYGMLGEAIRRAQLGVGVPTSDPAACAAGLEDLLSGRVTPSSEGMTGYADGNTAGVFADRIIATTVEGAV